MNRNATVFMNTLISGAVLLISQQALASPPTVEVLRTPDHGLQPRVAISQDGTLNLVYLTGDPKSADVQFIRRAPNDKDFSTPIRVNSQSGSACAIGTVRGPSIAVEATGRVHVLWNGSGSAEPKGPLPKDSKTGNTPALYTRSDEPATAFEPQRNLMTASWYLDGGASVSVDKSGRVAAVWHGADAAKPAGEENRAIFIAWSKDHGATFANEYRLPESTDGACACCGLFAFIDRSDHLSILYRRALHASERDETVLTESGSGKFTSTRIDPWPLRACPMTTADAFAVQDSVLLAWETQGQVWVGKWDGKAIKAKASAPGEGAGRKHPRIAALKTGEVLLAWTEGTGWERGGTVSWQAFDPALKPIQGATGHADGLPPWDFPAVWTATDHFVLMY